MVFTYSMFSFWDKTSNCGMQKPYKQKKHMAVGKPLCLIVMKNTPVLPSLLVDTLTGIHYEIG